MHNWLIFQRVRWPNAEPTVQMLSITALSGGIMFLWTGHRTESIINPQIFEV